MKTIAILIMCLMLSGCSPATRMLNSLPDAEFEAFHYRRTGNVSSASINATNAIKVGDMIEVEKVEIVETFPFVDFYLELKGFKR